VVDREIARYRNFVIGRIRVDRSEEDAVLTQTRRPEVKQVLKALLDAAAAIDDAANADVQFRAEVIHPTLDVLEGLMETIARNDASALIAAGGPTRWARLRLDRLRTTGKAESTADVGRAFVRFSTELFNLWRSPDALLELSQAQLLCGCVAKWLIMVGAYYDFVGAPVSVTAADGSRCRAETRMITEVHALAERRVRFGPQWCAALLRGWGIQDPHSLLKHAY
jgi:hypothetical protein